MENLVAIEISTISSSVENNLLPLLADTFNSTNFFMFGKTYAISFFKSINSIPISGIKNNSNINNIQKFIKIYKNEKKFSNNINNPYRSHLTG